MNPLLEKYLIGSKERLANYNVEKLKSYAGYPVVSSKSLGLDNYFSNDGKNVAGMAWGGNSNPPGQGGGEPSSIVVNPSFFKNDPTAQNSLVKLEAARHWMSENKYQPKFSITPEMKKWREQFNPKKIGPSGSAYFNDDQKFRETLISRFIAGGANVPPANKELLDEVKHVTKQVENANERSQPKIEDLITQSIRSKNK